MLQNIANGIEADSKEEFMMPTNQLLKKYQENMKKFFAELAVRNYLHLNYFDFINRPKELQEKLV